MKKKTQTVIMITIGHINLIHIYLIKENFQSRTTNDGSPKLVQYMHDPLH